MLATTNYYIGNIRPIVAILGLTSEQIWVEDIKLNSSV